MHCFKMSLWVAVAVLSVASAAASVPCVCEEDRTECSEHEKTSIQPQDICPGSTTWIFCDNALTALPRGVDERVEDLDLARNRIAAASNELRALRGLRRLDVSGNLLEHLRFLPEHCGLSHLDAKGNRISTLEGPLAGCAHLEELRLADNQLRSVSPETFAGLGRLTLLSLAQNPLRTLNPNGFRGLANLRTLELRSADLEALPDGAFTGLRELRTLDLDNNHLRSLTRAAFQGLTVLSDLHLCDNHITELPADAFREVQNLSALYLDHNEISALPDGLLTGLPLAELWVQGNRLDRLPVLRECCGPLRAAAFDRNRVAAPSETALRALLRGGVERASLEGNPVRPDALAWAARATDVVLRASPDDCHCGVVAKESTPHAAVSFCVDVECGHGAPWLTWVEAVRAAAQSAR